MRMASVISMPMGVGLAALAFPIVNVLYPNSHLAGPGLLRIMGVASFFVCIVLMENAILQGNEEDGEPGTVCQVLQKGYRMGDKVLRHAMVKVVPE